MQHTLTMRCDRAKTHIDAEYEYMHSVVHNKQMSSH